MFWTKAFWAFIHTVAETIDVNPQPSKKQHIFNFFRNLASFLPCQKCSRHYNEYINKKETEMQLITAIKNGKDALVAWAIEMHNHVNTQTGASVYVGSRALEEHQNLINQAVALPKSTISMLSAAAAIAILLAIWLYLKK